MIKIVAKKAFAVVVMVTTLISGVCWLASADAQVKSLAAIPENALKLVELSAYLNQWAAGAAMVGGICIALALMVDD